MSIEEKIRETYDNVHYESFPFKQTSPERLNAIGKLFGMNPPKLETARVLELGCSFGRNITPLATKYPKAKFVGIDISDSQIEKGQQEIAALGLKNLELKAMSITDIDKEFGEFDYIISHGVLSWVPENVRQKILEVSKQNLSKDGIAYISYNTLPGWNMSSTIRDMMMYHGQAFDNPTEKVTQAKLLLDFVHESVAESGSAHAKFLKQNIDDLKQRRSDYILHEYLEITNQAFYFHDFATQAAKQGLQYLADANLSSMHIGNLSAEAMEKLQGINDIVRQEQYMDFVSNRKFRTSLLCHQEQKLNRNLTPDSIKDVLLKANVTTNKQYNAEQLNSTERLEFEIAGAEVYSDNIIFKCALSVLASNKGYPISLQKLVTKVSALLTEKLSIKSLTDFIGQEILQLAFKGLIDLTAAAPTKPPAKLDKPKLSDIAYHQASTDGLMWVTTNNHDIFPINGPEKIALQYMDGSNTKSDIVAKLVEGAKNNLINVDIDGQKVGDVKQLEDIMGKLFDELLAKAVDSDILE